MPRKHLLLIVIALLASGCAGREAPSCPRGEAFSINPTVEAPR